MQVHGYFINSKWELYSRNDSKWSINSVKSSTSQPHRGSLAKPRHSDPDLKDQRKPSVHFSTSDVLFPDSKDAFVPPLTATVQQENQIPNEVPEPVSVDVPQQPEQPKIEKRPSIAKTVPKMKSPPPVEPKPVDPPAPIEKNQIKVEEKEIEEEQPEEPMKPPIPEVIDEPPPSKPTSPLAEQKIEYQVEPLSAFQHQSFSKCISCFSEKTVQYTLAKQMEPKEQGLAYIATALDSFMAQTKRPHVSPNLYEPFKKLPKVKIEKKDLDSLYVIEAGFVLARKLSEDTREKVGSYAIALLEAALCISFICGFLDDL